MIGSVSPGVDATAILAAAGLGLVAVFQLALALGAPFGRASWGGTHDGVLPANLRIASAAAVVLWSLAALVILSRAGLGPWVGEWTRWVTWALAAVLVVGALMNAVSRSRWERFGWAPFTLVIGVLCVVVARG